MEIASVVPVSNSLIFKVIVSVAEQPPGFVIITESKSPWLKGVVKLAVESTFPETDPEFTGKLLI